jgi:hypothetical protein
MGSSPTGDVVVPPAEAMPRNVMMGPMLSSTPVKRCEIDTRSAAVTLPSRLASAPEQLGTVPPSTAAALLPSPSTISAES